MDSHDRTQRTTNQPSCEFLEPRQLLAAAAVSINAHKPNASETNPTATGRGQFVIRRSGPTTSPLVVNYRLAAGSTAISGIDFLRLASSATIPAGRAYTFVDVIPIDDRLAERRETVALQLDRSSRYSLVRDTARITIADNEPVVSIASADPAASETEPTGAGAGRFIIRRTGSLAKLLTVKFHARGASTADSGADFAPLPAAINIPAGRTYAYINVTPVDDDAQEDRESVIVQLDASPMYTRAARYFSTVRIEDNDQPRLAWWNNNWHFRVPIFVSAASSARTDKVVEQAVNFTQALAQLHTSGALIENSLRVIEVTEDGQTVLDENVPFQFDRAGDFNASTNAAGVVALLMKGNTDANAMRFYHVYFDTTGTFAPATFQPLVTVTDNQSDEGLAAVKIQTTTATYFYQKQAGAFSSILDRDGNDWVGFNPTPGSQGSGEDRGIPTGGGGFHPGFNNGTTTIVNSGPLKTTLITDRTSDAGEAWRMRWDIYPTYAVGTMLVAPRPYWFLYEGVPGGSIDLSDFVVRSDGTQTEINQSWTEDNGLGAQSGQEWAYFADGAVNRFMFFAHNDTDNLTDSYFLLPGGQMTVFGFGRHNLDTFMTAVPNHFTIGLADGGSNVAAAGGVINGASVALATSVGSGEERPG
jgi:hypothetical protein